MGFFDKISEPVIRTKGKSKGMFANIGEPEVRLQRKKNIPLKGEPVTGIVAILEVEKGYGMYAAVKSKDKEIGTAYHLHKSSTSKGASRSVFYFNPETNKIARYISNTTLPMSVKNDIVRKFKYRPDSIVVGEITSNLEFKVTSL